MKIALIHYHLKRGGVTSVIRHQVEAIRSMGWEPMVLTGEPPDEAFSCVVQTIEGLAYDRHLPPRITTQQISDAVLGAFKSNWPDGPDVVHVHNPTLGKNSHLQGVIKSLQLSGMKLLCQTHDFAEDGRPDFYIQGPYLEDCHYAVLNPRDYQLLLDAGLDPAGCHLLPNTVAVVPRIPDDGSEPYGVLYPVRALRRKNIGEALLLTLYFEEMGPLQITLPPNSPADVQCYQRWQAFAQKHELPVEFDVGLLHDFAAVLHRCRFVITTSITEGFGFAFLEPWAAGKALWGRWLPDVCQGFQNQGVRFDWLYRRLRVPLAWLDSDRLASQWQSTLAEAHHRLGLSCPHERLDAAWQSICQDDLIDFGLLNEHFQRQVMRRILNASADRTKLMRINPFLEHPQPPEDDQNLIASNQKVINKFYGPVSYGRQLEAVYHRVASRSVRHRLNKEVLARFFLSPQEFSLLKWGGAL